MAEIKKISTELQLLNKFLDTSGGAGTSGQVLSSTATGISWINGSSIIGGPYLPLSAGSTVPLTGDLYLGAFNKISGVTGDNLVIGVDINNSSGASSFDIQMDGSTSAFYINNSRNVGINTTSPGEKLDVAGNIKITAALLSNQENTDVDTGTETVASVAIATYTAAFFDFVIKKTTNVRSGTVYACHDGTNVEFTETSTNDLGDTSDVTLSVDISGTNMRLLATVTSDDWSVKSLIRAI